MNKVSKKGVIVHVSSPKFENHRVLTLQTCWLYIKEREESVAETVPESNLDCLQTREVDSFRK
jgi:hypothetical protein